MPDASNPKQRPPVWLWFVIIGITAGVAYLGQQQRPSGMDWREDLANARREARANGKAMLLYFAKPGQFDCERMADHVWPVRQVRKGIKRVSVPLFLDWDEEQTQSLAERYNIGGIPSLVFTRAGGEMLRSQSGEPIRSEGYTDETKIYDMVEDVGEQLDR